MKRSGHQHRSGASVVKVEDVLLPLSHVTPLVVVLIALWTLDSRWYNGDADNNAKIKTSPETLQ